MLFKIQTRSAPQGGPKVYMASLPDLSEKVAFLREAGNYAENTTQVETRETHMSWVFLTNTKAWKLKKPVHYKHLDFSTPEARRKHCEEEVRLNRRLARNVYLGVVPLTVEPSGRLLLGGNGPAVDWLVEMRRLPSERMLDQTIFDHTWTEGDIHKVGALLAQFYAQLDPVPMTGAEYRERLRKDLVSTRRELLHARYGLPKDLVRAITAKGLRCIEKHPDLLEARAQSGKIVEAHGDLRPEHICLEPEPVIVDCLEFNRSLRLLDPASELTFLALECERLGEPRVGEMILEDYVKLNGDHPPEPVLHLYRCYHACTRAKVAIWHLKDGVAFREKWVARALDYLKRASDSSISTIEPPV